ncbi:TPA: DUF4878 domain-containing protein [Bacillus paranthracis]|nr:DUF4878 domain-containing protein [Bacillus paranthracis]
MKKSILRTIFLIMIMTLSISVLSGCTGDKRDPKEIVTAYFENAKDGKVDEFELLFTEEAKKMIANNGGMTDFMNFLNRELKNYEIKDVNEKNELATVNVIVDYKTKGQKQTTIQLRKVENAWRINNS